MLTLIAGLFLLSSSFGFFAFTLVKVSNQGAYQSWELGVTFAVIAILCVIGALASVLIDQYSESIYLPLRLDALNKTIGEQSEFITGENNVGVGLEGLAIKQEIQETIRERNELTATINYMRRSPWYLFKPLIGS